MPITDFAVSNIQDLIRTLRQAGMHAEADRFDAEFRSVLTHNDQGRADDLQKRLSDSAREAVLTNQTDITLEQEARNILFQAVGPEEYELFTDAKRNQIASLIREELEEGVLPDQIIQTSGATGPTTSASTSTRAVAATASAAPRSSGTPTAT